MPHRMGELVTEARKITIAREDPRWQEYGRELLVAVWHNKHQPTVLPITREEAANMRDLLEDFLRGEA